MSLVLPARILMYWDAAERPDYIEQRVDSWRSVYDGFDLTVLDRARSLEFLEDHREDFPGSLGTALAETFRAARLPAMQADLIRVGWIYLNGGLYADATITALQRLDSLLTPTTSVMVYRRWNGNINNGLFWASQRSPFVEEILGRIEEDAWRRRVNNVFNATGPGQFNTQVAAWTGRPDLTVVEHADIAGHFVDFAHDFPHKKRGRHWSELQDRVCVYGDYRGEPRRVLLHFGNGDSDRRLRRALVAHREELAGHEVTLWPTPAAPGLLRRNRPPEIPAWAEVQAQVWQDVDLPTVFAGDAYREAQRAVAAALQAPAAAYVVSDPRLFGSPHHTTTSVAASLFFEQERVSVVTELPGPKALRLIEELTGSAPVQVGDLADVLALSSERGRRP